MNGTIIKVVYIKITKEILQPKALTYDLPSAELTVECVSTKPVENLDKALSLRLGSQRLPDYSFRPTSSSRTSSNLQLFSLFNQHINGRWLYL